jgi:23S rRNA (adenine2503-C2)-methyltransferase
MKPDLRDFTFEELAEQIKALGYPAFRAKQAYDWLYKSRVDSIEAMKNVPHEMKEALVAAYSVNLPVIKAEARSQVDDTVKYLFEFPDGARIESVLMFDRDRITLCASTQAGCACGCRFCATGALGFTRDLLPSEILGQFIAAEKASGAKITNMVIMGMGEPFLNWENLKKALSILSDGRGMNFSQTRITISTVGITPVIREIASGKYKFNLAISLVTADDEKRSGLMPYNKKYTIKDIISAVKYYNKETERDITIEYIMFEGINDSQDDAENLIAALRGIDYKVNIIPYNSIDTPQGAQAGLKRPKKDTILAFQKTLMDAGKKAFIRREKGGDIAAACGQLAGRAEGL